ncbi:MAG: hypothetical protein R2850_13150 [Bacteroidia bacterium]
MRYKFFFLLALLKISSPLRLPAGKEGGEAGRGVFRAIQSLLKSGPKLRISLNFFAYFLVSRQESKSPKAL